jgi:hypothetical protein
MFDSLIDGLFDVRVNLRTWREVLASVDPQGGILWWRK